MFGSNPGVCNVESTRVEAVVPVSGVGGGALFSVRRKVSAWFWPRGKRCKRQVC